MHADSPFNEGHHHDFGQFGVFGPYRRRLAPRAGAPRARPFDRPPEPPSRGQTISLQGDRGPLPAVPHRWRGERWLSRREGREEVASASEASELGGVRPEAAKRRGVRQSEVDRRRYQGPVGAERPQNMGAIAGHGNPDNQTHRLASPTRRPNSSRSSSSLGSYRPPVSRRTLIIVVTRPMTSASATFPSSAAVSMAKIRSW